MGPRAELPEEQRLDVRPDGVNTDGRGVVQTIVAILSIAGLVGVLVFTNNEAHRKDIDALRERVAALEEIAPNPPAVTRLIENLETKFDSHTQLPGHPGALGAIGRLEEKLTQMESERTIRSLEDDRLEKELERLRELVKEYKEDQSRINQDQDQRLRILERDVTIRGEQP